MALSSAALLCSAGLLAGTAGPAQAAGSCSASAAEGATHPAADIDGDGTDDVVVGLPNLTVGDHPDAGGFDAHLSTVVAQRVTEADVTREGGPQDNDRFGSAIAIAQLDGDGCADLAVGSPGDHGRGAVYLLPGFTSGVDTTAPVKLTAPDGAAGDDFGSSVAASRRADASTDLWVGAPGHAVTGAAEAGQVYHYLVGPDGVAQLLGTVSFATAGVSGSPAAGDRFGEVLAATSDGVIVGVPRRRVSGHAEAGVIVVLSQQDGDLTSSVYSQASAGVAGSPEDGDHYGAAVAVAVGARTWVVGIPDEDIGSVRDAGAVDYYRADSYSRRAQVRSYNEQTSGIPGVAEEGDRFGAAVALGQDLRCTTGSATAIAVGAPGESVGDVDRAGAVTVFPTQPDASCPARVYRRGTLLAGAPAADDQVGAALADLSVSGDELGEGARRLLIGIPGLDDAASDAGSVASADSDPTFTAVGGAVEGLRYGSVLAHAAYDAG